jgi:quercetin dioxygenase-like cupin family protein
MPNRLLLVATVMAAVGTMPVASAAAAATEPLVLLQSELPLNTVYAWERWGNFINAIPGDGKEIPYDAAKLFARVYTFPFGEIRVIDFTRGTRTHNHINMTDIIQYTWTGQRVQFAQDQAEITRPGDAALHPKGIFHHGEAVLAGKTVEFSYKLDKAQANPRAHWLNTNTNPLQKAALWTDKGSYREAVGAAAGNAPSSAMRFELRSYDFGPYVTRELHLPKGAILPIQDDKNHLMFVGAGSFSFSGGGKTCRLGVEDAAIAPAGERVTLTALEDSTLIETLTAPRPAG